MNNAAPECYGKYSNQPKCAGCEFADSCKYFAGAETQTKKLENDIKHGLSYDDSRSHITNELPVDLESNKTYTHDEVVALCAFMLRVGRDRKLGPVVSAKLTGASSFAEIARREGVTRQAIHKRVGQQLARLLGYKNRQLTDSRLLTLSKEEFQMLKLIRAGADDSDIREIMNLSFKELKTKKEELDHKITRWT